MATAPANEAVTELDERTKPPFLRRVQIRNYKSIAFCDVALQPLTILVGRNASGKSNFLDGLSFLRDLLTKGAAEAVRLHGGRKAILHRGGRGTTISIRLEVAFQQLVPHQLLPLNECVADYSLQVKLPARFQAASLNERVRIKTSDNAATTGFYRNNEHIKFIGVYDASAPRISHCDPDRSFLSSYNYSSPVFVLWDKLLGAGFYNFAPEAIRALQTPTPIAPLERNGRNLASVIESLRELDEPTISRIEAYLTAIVGDLEAVKVVHYGEYETVRFRFRAGSRKKPLEFDAASMSDGTLRALAALVAAFQIKSNLYVGFGLVGIEEPETALHPAAMRALVDAMEEATGRTQILLTTHSPDLLADRDLHPSQILVVRNRDGKTLITPVDAASREIVAKELSTLADLQRQDLLDLDESDLQRQAAEQADEARE